MAETIEIEVVTPAAAVLDAKAEEVILPGVEGELGILPGHLPLLTALDVGPMQVKQNGKIREFYLEGGFAEISHDKITVLTETCRGVDEIDIEHAQLLRAEAEQELAELIERAKSETIEPDVVEYHQRKLKRAQTQLLMGEERR